MFLPVVVMAGFAICVLFPTCTQPLGEAGGFIGLPFIGAWLTTCVLVVAHAHCTFARCSNPLIHFAGPIGVGVLYASLTIWVGSTAGIWLAAHILPTGLR